MKKTVYQTSVSVTGGRNGKVVSEDGLLELDVRMPNSLGGNGGATNPEQLFAAGYAACFDSALNMVAQQEGLKISSEINAKVSLQMSETEGFNIAAELTAKIEGVAKDTAEKLLNMAHATCPYSKAISGNVEVSVSLA
ncbi:organic hydroperoxide resistance protein [Algivirga pacifica]|uniref:Organic hydroperoxide resistance protein n=1 Tax=Algivirga pacifica TaxID=1162670 RepID=A0ABP9DLR3_9BACT